MNTCETCVFWHGTPASYRAPCAISASYVDPTCNDGCEKHRARATLSAAQQPAARALSPSERERLVDLWLMNEA